MIVQSTDRLAELLSEGLDLCARARKLDEQVDRALQADMGRIYPEGTRCMTPALWVQEQYETDLCEWEKRAKAALFEMGFAR